VTPCVIEITYNNNKFIEYLVSIIPSDTNIDLVFIKNKSDPAKAKIVSINIDMSNNFIQEYFVITQLVLTQITVIAYKKCLSIL
jgi:hypothetical protein